MTDTISHVFTPYCFVRTLLSEGAIPTCSPSSDPKRYSAVRMQRISHLIHAVSCISERFFRLDPTPIHTRVTELDRDDSRLGLPHDTTWTPTRNVHDTPGGGNGRKRTATNDDNDNDITIACVLRWFRSYTEDQGTHTHVCRLGRQVEEGGRDREVGGGGVWLRREGSPRSCAPAAHTSGTRHTHTRGYTCALSLSLSLFLFLTHKCACTMYLRSRAAEISLASRSRKRNRESTLVRLRTCMCRMLAWCTGPLHVHFDRVLSPSRECSSCTPLHRIVSRAHGMRACVSTCERTVCLHAKRQRHAVPHTGNPSSGAPSPRPASAPRHLASLTYDTIRYEQATRQAGSAQN